MSAQAAAFNDQFVQHLTAGAFSYASIQAALASLLQDANGFVRVLDLLAQLGVVSFAGSKPQQLLSDLLFVPLAVVFFGSVFLLGIYIGILGHLQ